MTLNTITPEAAFVIAGTAFGTLCLATMLILSLALSGIIVSSYLGENIFNRGWEYFEDKLFDYLPFVMVVIIFFPAWIIAKGAPYLETVEKVIGSGVIILLTMLLTMLLGSLVIVAAGFMLTLHVSRGLLLIFKVSEKPRNWISKILASAVASGLLCQILNYLIS